MAQNADINKVLTDMKSAIQNKTCTLIPRRKNMDTLAQLGLTWQDAKDEIYALTPQEYFKGPEIDRDFPSSDRFWIFKKRIEKNVVYIKFKVLYQEDGSVKFVSFHIDEI